MNRRILIFLLLLLLAISYIIACGPSLEPTVLPDGTKIFDRGELKYIEGVPFLKVEGSYYDMGVQYGVLLREETKEICNRIAEIRNQSIADYPFAMWSFDTMVRKALDKIPQRFKDELRGVSYATGINYYELASGQFFHELFCTSALNKSNGKFLHGRNLDYGPLFLGDYPVVVEFNPDEKLKYTMVGIIGYFPILSAINEKGISASVDAVSIYNRPEEYEMTLGYKLIEIMESAENIADVDNMLNGYSSNVGWSVTIGSSTEHNGAIYDIAGAEIVKNTLTSNYIGVSNFFVDEGLCRKYMRLTSAESPFNQGRYESLMTLLSNMPDNTPNNMIDVFASVDFKDYSNMIGHIQLTTNSEATIQTIVFDGEGKDIYFSSTHGYAGWSKFLKYDMETREVSIFRDENPNFDYAEQISLWCTNADTYLNSGDCAGLVNSVDLNNENITLAEVYFLCSAWQMDKNCISSSNLIAQIDKLITRYPELDIPYVLKGDVLRQTGDYDNAILFFEDALEVDYSYGEYKMFSHYFLAMCYDIKGNSTLAIQNAESCIDMIEGYVIGKWEQIYIDNMNEIIQNNS